MTNVLNDRNTINVAMVKQLEITKSKWVIIESLAILLRPLQVDTTQRHTLSSINV
jgi:hypothetical protein